MIEQDTVKLLRECDAGIKMGTASLDDVIGHTDSDSLREKLDGYKKEYNDLQSEMQSLLAEYGDDGKNPSAAARCMSWMKTNMKLSTMESDAAIADLMTDGCNMGVKSLNRYLNEYAAADEKSKNIAKRLINLMERQTDEICQYL